MNKTEPLQAHFERLDTLLVQHQDLWRPAPFCFPMLAWEAHHPTLAAALLALDDKQVTALEMDAAALVRWLADYLPALAGITALASVPALPARVTDYPRGFERDIPGRKWQQVTAFTACLEQFDGPVLEWCAGKAHLGRAIHQRFGTPVTALEWDGGLCTRGNALSARLQLGVKLEQCDVLSAAAGPYLRGAPHAVALHACGDLHRRLIETAIAQALASLDLSPCCYHLTTDSRYQPFSRAGGRSALALHRDDCRLAVQETVTAPANSGPRRHKKNAWRLGFDALQRQLRGLDEYLPVPPLGDAAFAGSFAAFCQRAATLKAVALPGTVDWPHFEQQGWQRQARVNRMELPRHAFRRVLELWLVLDRALHLQDCGYQVAVGTFCERQLTPRNLMIRARRQPTGEIQQTRCTGGSFPGC